MSESTPRRRGRPRTHDPEAALRGVIPAFWTGGYDATSLDALSEAAGMNRPSLYAALGDKRAMYLAALERMREVVLRGAAESLDAHHDLAAALRAFYGAAIDTYMVGEGEARRGCLVVCTATTAAYDDAEIAAAVRAMVDSVEELLAARFKRAGVDKPTRRARMAGAVLHSMAVRARARVPRRELDRLAGDAVALLAA